MSATPTGESASWQQPKYYSSQLWRQCAKSQRDLGGQSPFEKGIMPMQVNLTPGQEAVVKYAIKSGRLQRAAEAVEEAPLL